MIELMNGLQIGAGAEGLNNLKQTGVPSGTGQSDFSKLLEEMKAGGATDKELLSIMSQNLKGSEATHLNKELKESLSKLTNEMSEDGQMTPELMASLEESDTTLVDSSKTKGKLDFLTNPEGTAKTVKTSGELRMGLPNKAINLEADLANAESKNIKSPEMLEKATNLKTKLAEQKPLEAASFDHRLAPQLQAMQPKKGKTTSQIHFSEDFVSQKSIQEGNGKPLVTGTSKAVNLFKEEQSVLSDTGIIKRNTQSSLKTGELSFNSAAKEKVSGSFDTVSASSEVSQNLNQGPEIGGLITPKTEITSSIQTSGGDVKALDLSQVKDPQQLLSEISNYIETSRISSGKELEVVVKHNDLGQFKINAQKGQGDLIDLQIIANSDEAHSFFNKNEVNLLKTLTTQGVKVSDFKLSMGESSSSNASGNNSSGQDSSGNENEFARNYNSGDDLQRDGRQRRQELWNDYRERLGA